MNLTYNQKLANCLQAMDKQGFVLLDVCRINKYTKLTITNNQNRNVEDAINIAKTSFHTKVLSWRNLNTNNTSYTLEIEG